MMPNLNPAGRLNRPPTVHIPTRARGRMRWELLDAAGRVDVARTLAAGGGRWQKNLITDLGLRKMFAECTSATAFSGSATGSPRYYLILGDGSTPPDAADTALESFVAATSADGGFTSTNVLAEVGSDMVLTSTFTRVYTAAANVTLREWGFSDKNDGTDAYIRALFLDGGGSPVSVSLLEGRKLRVTHELAVAIPLSSAVSFDVERYDTGGSLVSTDAYTGTVHPYCSTAANSYLAQLFCAVGGVTSAAGNARTTPPSVGSDFNMSNLSGGAGSASASHGAATGTPTMIKRISVSEAQFQGDIKALCWSGSGSGQTSRSGLLLLLDDPQAITKTDLQTLTVDLALTFARA